MKPCLHKVHGQGFYVSVVRDPWSCYRCSECMSSTPEQLSLSVLIATVAAFKESLSLSQEEIDKPECGTRNQQQSLTLFCGRQYYLKSSLVWRHTVDREIFAVKIFSRIPPNAKIFVAKFIQQWTIITANVLRGCMHIKKFSLTFQFAKLFKEKIFHTKYF